MNNPRDMIELQNAMYKRRHEWNNQLAPISNWSSGKPDDIRRYWGWNEVPVNSTAIADHNNWDAVIVKLPANICKVANGTMDNATCLDSDARKNLETDLQFFVSKQHLKIGAAHLDEKPGSNVVFVREFQIGLDHWEREFFCANWTSPSKRFRIVHLTDAEHGKSACYTDAANITTVIPLASVPEAIAEADGEGVNSDVSTLYEEALANIKELATEFITV